MFWFVLKQKARDDHDIEHSFLRKPKTGSTIYLPF
jgi:hypothetical protein